MEPTQRSALTALLPLFVVWPAVGYLLEPLGLPTAINIGCVLVITIAVGLPAYLMLIRLQRRKLTIDEELDIRDY